MMMVKMVKVMKRRKGVNMKKCEHTLKDSPLDNFEVLLLLNFWDKWYIYDIYNIHEYTLIYQRQSNEEQPLKSGNSGSCLWPATFLFVNVMIKYKFVSPSNI